MRPGLYAILDLPDPAGHEVAAHARALVTGGATTLQLRAKYATTGERSMLLRAMLPVAQDAGVPLVVNDDLEAALAIPGVWGVHLGQEDLATLDEPARAAVRDAGLGLGVSTHDLDQVAEARAYDPDYIGFGPVFSTMTKEDAEPVVGVDALARAVALSAVPVVAIGGLDGPRAIPCVRAGATAVAMIGALRGPSTDAVEARARAAWVHIEQLYQ